MTGWLRQGVAAVAGEAGKWLERRGSMQSVGDRGRLIGRGLGAGRLGLAALALGAVWLAPVLQAGDATPAARAVRLSSVDGQVQLAQGNQVLADEAVANTPLFAGTRVTTGDDGRAEIQFEDGSVARLSPNSSLTLTMLRGQDGNGEAEIALESGLGYFELQGTGQSGTIRVKFSDSVVTAGGFTVMRINLDSPPGELAVFSGNAHLERGGAMTVDLHGGESVALIGSDPSRYTLAESIEPDSWDTWNSDRDQVLTSEAAAKTGATKNYGDNSNPAWNDLDASGNWYNVPGQGNIWSPYEASGAGWDPYGNGYWMNTPGYGYIWASGYPWGYLPYQCGMWNWYDAFGWGWAPGMEGCSPWWGMGGYFGPNIGNGFGGYRPPLRPHPPRRPLGGRAQRANTLIAVNRRPVGGSTALPARDRAAPVTIAGQTVQPLRPLGARAQYDHSASAYVNRTVSVFPGSSLGAGSGGGQARATGPSFGGSKAGSSSGSGARSPGSSQHSSSGGGTSASHSSGGGTSASHTSGGGGGFSGGGGGGAAHSGGGGGGHH